MDWQAPAAMPIHHIAQLQREAAAIYLPIDDYDMLEEEMHGPAPLAIEDAPQQAAAHAPDTIMAPEPMPHAIVPLPGPSPITPPRKPQDEPPMSQPKRAKGDKGIAIKIKTMADGLDMAYDNAQSRATLGTVVFLAGTKTWTDVGDDILIMEGRVRETQKYREVREWLFNLPFHPTMIVGHSLGAAVARALAEDFDLLCTTFNDPTPSWNRNQPGNFSSANDPVSFFNWGQSSSPSDSWNPHSYHAKASRRSFNLHPRAKDDIP